MTRSRNLWHRTPLAALLLLSACATAVQPVSDPYREVNRSLRGERAIVELEDGEVAADVSQVRLTESEATWLQNGRRRQEPTGEVARVIVVSPPSRAPAGFILLLGLALSIVVEDPAPLDLALHVAFDSFVWGEAVSPNVGRVVYAGAEPGE